MCSPSNAHLFMRSSFFSSTSCQLPVSGNFWLPLSSCIMVPAVGKSIAAAKCSKAAAKQTQWAAEEPRPTPTVSSESQPHCNWLQTAMSPFSPSPPLQMGWEMTNIGFTIHIKIMERTFFSSRKDWCIQRQESHYCSHCPLWSIPWQLIQNKRSSQVISTSEHFNTAGFPHLKSLPSSWGQLMWTFKCGSSKTRNSSAPAKKQHVWTGIKRKETYEMAEKTPDTRFWS